MRVGIVNDYAIVVAGLHALLEPYTDRIDVVELVAGQQADHDADIVLFDSFAQSLLTGKVTDVAPPEIPVVVFTWDTRPHVRQLALEWGAVDCLPKSIEPDELVAALEKVHASSIAPEPIAGRRRNGRAPARVRRWPGQHAGLTERESEVLALLVAGHSNTEIAQLLHLSVNSVKTYLRHAYRKADVGRRSQAVIWGLEHGFDSDVTRRQPDRG